jgi:YidC/Oxa1 family membrane protein insertase
VDITEPTIDGWGPLLLVVYVASQLTSSYYMSTSMQRAQRILLLVLPIVFIPFILNFPAGLMVYWLTTNLWTTGQGFITRRLMPKPVTAGAEKKSSRTPPKEAPKEEAKASSTASGSGAAKDGAPVVAGPPRRVKRKRSGGGRRR